MLLVGALVQIWKFSYPRQNFWCGLPTLKDAWKTSQYNKYRKLWTMECIKFAQGWEVVLLIDPNGIHKNITLEITSYYFLLSKIFYFGKELMKTILVHGYFMIALNFWQIQSRLSYHIFFQWSKWKMKKVTCILKGTKCFYDRQSLVRLGKVFNYN